MSYTNETKPAKKHYNKFLSRVNGLWIFDKNEVVCEVSKSTVETAKAAITLKPWYPTELAVAYGLKKGLIELEASGNRFAVKFTDKGMVDLVKQQKTTCAFTGRRIKRGEF